MQANQKIVVKIVACVTAATGLFVLVPGWRSHFHFWTHPLQSVASLDPFYSVLCFVVMVIPILKLVAAVGLFRNKHWAWFSGIAVLTADFVLRANVAITMFLIDALVPPTPPPPMPEGGVTMVIPLWPSYVIAIISIASVLVLIQKPIKNLFAKSKSLSENHVLR